MIRKGNVDTGKFAVNATQTGFVFKLKAGSGEVIAVSETYKSRDACMNGIDEREEKCARCRADSRKIIFYGKTQTDVYDSRF